MPNWCSTNYYVKSENKNQLFKFYLDCVIAGLKGDWLGRIYEQAGYKTEKTKEGYTVFAGDDKEWIRCRGHVTNVEICGNPDGKKEVGLEDIGKGIEICCETAWEPLLNSFERMLREKYPDLEVLCLAEECGCEVYVNTDVNHEHFKEKWVLTANNEDMGYDERTFNYDQENDLLKTIEELTGIKYKSVSDVDEEEMLKGYSKKTGHKSEKCYIALHEYSAY